MSMIKQIVCIGCIFSACAKPPEYAKRAGDAAKSFSLQVAREEGVTPLGSGGFYTNKKIDSFYIDFETKKRLLPEDAKTLLVTIVDQFVNAINSNEEMRPFLQTFPVTANQVSISIGLVDEGRKPLLGFSQIHLYEGIIYYSTFESEKKEYSPYERELYPQ